MAENDVIVITRTSRRSVDKVQPADSGTGVVKLHICVLLGDGRTVWWSESDPIQERDSSPPLLTHETKESIEYSTHLLQSVQHRTEGRLLLIIAIPWERPAVTGEGFWNPG